MIKNLIKDNPIDTLGIILGTLMIIALSSWIGWLTILVLAYSVLIPYYFLYLLPREFIDNLYLFKKYEDLRFFIIATLHLIGGAIVILAIINLVGSL